METRTTAAGISIYQQDDNYINFTIERQRGKVGLKLLVKEKDQELEIVKQEALPDYKGEILLKIQSDNENYHYLYSLDGGKSFTNFARTKSNLVICRGYIGTNLGIYASSNGNSSKEYADFDWVRYKWNPRQKVLPALTAFQKRSDWSDFCIFAANTGAEMDLTA